jgi:hypothetical protein
LPATGAIPRDNLAAWQRYVTAETPLVEMARWGHQQPGAPWEARLTTVEVASAHDEPLHAIAGS